MTCPTDGLGLVKFESVVIMKNEPLLEYIGELQKRVSDLQADPKVIGDEMTKLKGSISLSDELSAKLA